MKWLMINRKLQLAISVYSLLIIALVNGVNVFAGLVILNHGKSWYSVWSLTIVLAITVALTLCCGLYLSHRIAGPILKLQMHMNEILEGRAQGELKFRVNDHFEDLLEPYNKLIKKIEKS